MKKTNGKVIRLYILKLNLARLTTRVWDKRAGWRGDKAGTPYQMRHNRYFYDNTYRDNLLSIDWLLFVLFCQQDPMWDTILLGKLKDKVLNKLLKFCLKKQTLWMKANIIMSPNEDALYPVAPVPLTAQLLFRLFLSLYILLSTQVNTPRLQGVDYWLSDLYLNKLHTSYWDKNILWTNRQQLLEALNSLYSNISNKISKLNNLYIKNLLSELLTKLQRKLNLLLNILSKLLSIADQINLQLLSLVLIYNTTHKQTISKALFLTLYDLILATKPKQFTAKYYKTLLWDPDLVPDVDLYDPKKDFYSEDDLLELF